MFGRAKTRRGFLVVAVAGGFWARGQHSVRPLPHGAAMRSSEGRGKPPPPKPEHNLVKSVQQLLRSQGHDQAQSTHLRAQDPPGRASIPEGPGHCRGRRADPRRRSAQWGWFPGRLNPDPAKQARCAKAIREGGDNGCQIQA